MNVITTERFQSGYIFPKPTAVAIGNFDGLHGGHLRVLSALKTLAISYELLAVVLSFRPHPIQFFSGSAQGNLLTSKEKTILLEEIGIDCYAEYPFDNSTAALSPRAFFTDILLGRLKAAAVVVGDGFRFGHMARGDAAVLEALGREHGVSVTAVEHAEAEAGKISSSAIKDFVLNGDFAKAKRHLTRNYFVSINGGEKVLPSDGIYSVKITTDGANYRRIEFI